MEKLLVRRGSSLSSAKVGSVGGKPGEELVLLFDGHKLDDGTTVRARIGRDMERTVQQLGWVTSIKGEKNFLAPVSTDLDERIGANKRAESASVASRIAQRRQAKHRPAAPVPWHSSSALAERASVLRRAAAAHEVRVFDAIEERIGHVLRASKRSDYDLGAASDSDGDGELSRDEFRRLVHGLAQDADAADAVVTSMGSDEEIDGLFEAMDVDGSGALRLREVQIAFAKLKAGVRYDAYDRAARELKALRAGAIAVQTMVEETRASEGKDAELALCKRGTVRTRLGDLLRAKSVKLQELRHKWDRDGNGKLDSAEFSARVRELGFEATDAEVHGLFCELDTDKSRSLAAAELPRAFNALLEESKKREQAEPLLAAAAAEARKITERGQQAALTLAQSAMEAVAGASLETEQAVE
jgi:Ca2+-binding EF-hand superfamily protein